MTLKEVPIAWNIDCGNYGSFCIRHQPEILKEIPYRAYYTYPDLEHIHTIFPNLKDGHIDFIQLVDEVLDNIEDNWFTDHQNALKWCTKAYHMIKQAIDSHNV